MSRPVFALALALALALPACAADAPVPRGASVEDRMLDHFFALASIERALMSGDLAEARHQARSLQEARPGDPPAWRPHVDDLRRTAAQLAGAPDLAGATHGVSKVLAVCHGCHRDLHVTFEPMSIPEPPAGDTLAAKMQRHQWGVDLLRVSLLFDDDAIWSRGVDVLTAAPLDPAELGESGRINPETIGHARRLRDVAAAARSRTGDERFAIYDRLLSTCVGCHATRTMASTPLNRARAGERRRGRR